MIFNKAMSKAVDKWFEMGGRIGNSPLQVGGRVNLDVSGQSKGVGDNSEGTRALKRDLHKGVPNEQI